MASSNPAMTTAYAMDMQSLRNKIQELRTLLNHTMEQIKQEIALIQPPHVSSDMEIDASQSPNLHQNQTQSPTKISSLLHDLKYDIATFVIEMHALPQHQSNPMMQNNYLPSKT